MNGNASAVVTVATMTLIKMINSAFTRTALNVAFSLFFVFRNGEGRDPSASSRAAAPALGAFRLAELLPAADGGPGVSPGAGDGPALPPPLPGDELF
jgi:hypothetical protein